MKAEEHIKEINDEISILKSLNHVNKTLKQSFSSNFNNFSPIF